MNLNVEPHVYAQRRHGKTVVRPQWGVVVTEVRATPDISGYQQIGIGRKFF